MVVVGANGVAVVAYDRVGIVFKEECCGWAVVVERERDNEKKWEVVK